MTNEQRNMESLLSSQVEQATWATGRVCEHADDINIVVDAFEQAHIAAATLGIYKILGDRTDVELLKLTHAVRDEVRKASHAIKHNCCPRHEALSGLWVPEDHTEHGHLLPGSLSDGAFAAVAADLG